MDIVSAAQTLVSATLADGGASMNPKTGELETAPVTLVGGATDITGNRVQETSVAVDDFTLEFAASYIRRQAVLAKDAYIGTWIENGRVILDASDAFTSLSVALFVAAERGERAVYTIGVGETVVAPIMATY
jgi:hypothetical protein